MYDFSADSADCARAIEAGLSDYLSGARLSGPGPAADRVVAAMRHGSLEGGKRLRPLLLRQAAAIFSIPRETSLLAGMAVEMVHCYSLIHDDLPAMDDDDLRRGRPTVHKAFDEASAILAGDALLTHAFAILADPACHADAEVRIRLVAELAAGSGVGGMVGGQMRDIEGEQGGFSETDIATMQAMKTGALIRAAVRMGAILGGADPRALSAMTAYAEAAGRAFQLADDILDVTATPEAMGKATGKDAALGKQTVVARLGLDGARAMLEAIVNEAILALRTFGPRADGLRATARYFASREN
ncbi:farnesyl diphosphate synthase [Devosia subaequoris]|uniref:Probable farnesyl diphosphate synthase n=1 Tax=Devosia subaequoris TaxID=395930 RepID=A0A7W6IPM1_9HYPH|nr:farnesyl diphosphate synthase [Devosia subaequoris]MBB4053453.1 farnesyl diphosphate synthase [Devosia subaequoris]MCP1210829.1 polyprenyl synthetase family protein [Devosia subaequoris]